MILLRNPKTHTSRLENKPYKIEIKQLLTRDLLHAEMQMNTCFGVVKVNGAVVTTLGTNVNRDDRITVRGNPIPENGTAKFILY